MAAGHELESIIISTTLAQEKTLKYTLSPFYQKAANVAAEMVWYIAPDHNWQKNLLFNETFNRMEPLISYLTKPRSIDDFRQMQEDVIRFLFLSNENNLDEVELDETERNMFSEKHGDSADWIGWPLSRLLSEYNIFSNTAVFESLDSGFISPEEAFEFLLDNIEFSKLARKDKIIDINKAVNISDELRSSNQEFSGRTGYIVGKFRNGVHDEHIQLIENAKRTLGYRGKLFIGLESEKSLHQRRGQDHFTLPDKVRIAQISELRSVDHVILHNPSGNDLVDLKSFYTREQEKLKPNFWFIGTEDYHWRPQFEQISQNIGAILLWDRSTTNVSTSDLIGER